MKCIVTYPLAFPDPKHSCIIDQPSMKLDSYSSRKRRVLKLVHPGGFSEIHKRPITAAEVMEKNPRHFVTRPDVFKFPWIVVHPDSVLKPGNVFFIVPYHTIHRLLNGNRSNHCNSHSFGFQNHQGSSILLDHYVIPSYYQETCSPLISGSWADHHDGAKPSTRGIHAAGFHNFHHQGQGLMDQIPSADDVDEETHFHQFLMKQCSVTPQTRSKVDFRYEDCNNIEDGIFPKCLIGSNNYNKQQGLDRKSTIKTGTQHDHVVGDYDDDDDDSPKKTYTVEQWLEVEGYKPASFDSFDHEPRFLISSHKLGKGDQGLEIISRSQEDDDRKLKSCLKKENSHAKSRGFRVRFVLPGEDDEKLRV